MKHLRKLCAALILALTLSPAALAGTIDCPGVTQPPPSGETVTGQMDCPGVTEVIVIFVEAVLPLA